MQVINVSTSCEKTVHSWNFLIGKHAGLIIGTTMIMLFLKVHPRNDDSTLCLTVVEYKYLM